MKKKKIMLIVSILVIILLVSITYIVIISNTNKQKPEEQFKQYIEFLKVGNYEEMYQTLTKASKEKINQEDFSKRNQNIYEGIEANNITIAVQKVEKEKETASITYQFNMDTVAGSINFENTVSYQKEDKQYKLAWSSRTIFPQLNEEDKVKVKTTTAQRGNIYDTKDILLAGKGTASSIGFVPGKMSDTKEEDITKVATLLDISVENINKMLSASYVKADTFVPIKTLAKSEQDLKNKLLEIKGIKIVDASTRLYPYAEKTSHLLGYVQKVNQEELTQLEQKGYNSSSVIGKSGIEKDFEATLRGIDGCEVLIIDNKGNQKQSLAKRDLKNGEDIKLTIDVAIQTKLYDQFSKDKSCSVAMNYQTGEILALVSTPTFDSNDFSMGMTNNQWNALTNDTDKPLYNRYKATWTPGSSFKPVIAAIGITTTKLDSNENFGRSGLSWQKDSSWGSYRVTTLKEYEEQVNLKNALINSDNIYFAKTAIKIGKETLAEQLLKLGFDKALTIQQGISKSTFGTNNKIDSEIQLADSGYGQGKVLVNPIHMASIYSAFMNEGNMVIPYLTDKTKTQAGDTKEQIFTKEAANTIKEDLIQVVESPEGTAHSAKIAGKTIAGKTGTAEIKDSKEDTEGTELGWFNAFTTDNTNNPLLIISMVEDVKGKGGSHYLLPKIKSIFQ